jgi:hypothetical protein
MSSTTPLPVQGDETPGQVSRRQAIQWVLAVTAAAALPRGTFGGLLDSKLPSPDGYGFDPNLVKGYKPGAFWPLTFNRDQKETATALSDVIIPKDDLGPAASSVGVPAYIDEWISAPYAPQQKDRTLILDGLFWLDNECMRRFNKFFTKASDAQKHEICDDIAYLPNAKPQFRQAAAFFDRFRSLAASAYYATPEGWKAIGYEGNVILQKFDGPPPAVLEKLDVKQTVA